MDEILNSKNINNLRFRMAKPQGYFTEDVEAFIDGTLKQSIAAYELKIREQEQSVKDLEDDNSQLRASVSELELKATFNEGTSNMSNDETLMEALAKQSQLESEIARLKEELEVKTTFANEMEAYLTQVEPYISAGYQVLNPDSASDEEPSSPVEEADAEAYIPAPKAVLNVEPNLGENRDVNAVNFFDEPEVEEEQSEPEADVNAIDSSLMLEEEEAIEPEMEEAEEESPQTVVDVNAVSPELLEASKKETKTSKSKKVEPEVVPAEEVDVHANIGLDNYEVDEEALRKAMAEAGIDEDEDEYDESETTTLPDGTVVPKGIRPEDL